MEQLKNKNILVVDDEVLIQEIIKELLESYGMKVTTAGNGLEAFELIKKETFDLVISDIRMPECSGLELLKLINAYDSSAPEVILVTAFNDISAERAKSLGAKGLFLKPGAIENIIDVIRESL
ncbi:MAG: two-component system response regulator [Halobacteriovoraceae bacterium]|nr:two-component system response regulator [Halobacteriovoraceae bacterium]